MKIYSISIAVAAFSTAVFAQTTPAPTTAAAPVPLAKHSCAKPAMPDASKKIATAEANALVRTLETFRNCVQVFFESQKAIAATKQREAEVLTASAQEASQAAAAAIAAANEAAKDYNALSEQAVKIVTPKEAAAPNKTNPVERPPTPQPQRGY